MLKLMVNVKFTETNSLKIVNSKFQNMQLYSTSVRITEKKIQEKIENSQKRFEGEIALKFLLP